MAPQRAERSREGSDEAGGGFGHPGGVLEAHGPGRLQRRYLTLLADRALPVAVRLVVMVVLRVGTGLRPGAGSQEDRPRILALRTMAGALEEAVSRRQERGQVEGQDSGPRTASPVLFTIAAHA
jgi:hypothetical protein